MLKTYSVNIIISPVLRPILYALFSALFPFLKPIVKQYKDIPSRQIIFDIWGLMSIIKLNIDNILTKIIINIRRDIMSLNFFRYFILSPNK